MVSGMPSESIELAARRSGRPVDYPETRTRTKEESPPLRNWFDCLRQRPKHRGRRRFSPVGCEGLEARKLLSTVARSGAYKVEVWLAPSGFNGDVFAQVSHNGQIVRHTVQVSTSDDRETQPTVSVNSNGRFVVAWHVDRGGFRTVVYVRAFNSNGEPLTPAMMVGDAVLDDTPPGVGLNNKGRFVVAYTVSTGSRLSDQDVHAVEFVPTNGSGTQYLKTAYGVATRPGYENREHEPSVYVSEHFWAVSYTVTDHRDRRFTDVGLFLHDTRNIHPWLTSYTLYAVNTHQNEDKSHIESFDASTNTLTISYVKNWYYKRFFVSLSLA